MVLAVIKEPVTEGRKGHGGRSCQAVAIFLLVAGGVGLPREAHFLDFLVRAVPLLAVERDVVQRGAVFLVAVHVGRACLRHVLHLLDAGGVPVCLGRSLWFLFLHPVGWMCYNGSVPNPWAFTLWSGGLFLLPLESSICAKEYQIALFPLCIFVSLACILFGFWGNCSFSRVCIGVQIHF